MRSQDSNMVSPEDIAEIAWEVLRDARPGRTSSEPRQGKWGELAGKPYNRPYSLFRSKRLFLSEYDILQRLKVNSKELRVPKSAILSPLAQDWIWEKGIQVVYE